MSLYSPTHYSPKRFNWDATMSFSNSSEQYEKLVDEHEPDDIEDDNFDILDKEEVIVIEEDELDFE